MFFWNHWEPNSIGRRLYYWQCHWRCVICSLLLACRRSIFSPSMWLHKPSCLSLLTPSLVLALRSPLCLTHSRPKCYAHIQWVHKQWSQNSSIEICGELGLGPSSESRSLHHKTASITFGASQISPAQMLTMRNHLECSWSSFQLSGSTIWRSVQTWLV